MEKKKDIFFNPEENYPEEKEVLPGIFITDFRKKSRENKIVAVAPSGKKEQKNPENENKDMKLTLTREEILERHDIIMHKERIIVRLLKTNKEIEQLGEEARNDPDLQEAIKDNINSILKHSDDIKIAKYELFISGNYLRDMIDNEDDDIPIPELEEIKKVKEEKEEIEGEDDESKEEEDGEGIFL